jgi:microcystin-dependent protein
MVDPTTSNIQLAVQAHLANAGAWDSPLNANFEILDDVFGSVTTKSLSASNVILTATECQVAILRFTGTLLANVTITLTTTIKSWICENNTTGAFTVTITGGSGEVIALPEGSCQIYWDGTNVKFINLGKVGELWDYVGSSVPAWVSACTVPPYLNGDGSSFSAVTYPSLNKILGGTTLPDLRGRVRANLNQATGRISAGGVNGDNNLAAGGADTHTLTTAELAVHSHGVTDPGHIHVEKANNSGGANTSIQRISGDTGTATDVSTVSATTGISINNAGSGSAHTILNPICVVGITMIRAM